MIVEDLPQIFKEARPIIKNLEQAGFKAYFVGGSVRDLLLKRPIHDVDIATNAYPAEVKRIFPVTIDTGIQHGTVTVKYGEEFYEVTTFRTESTYQDFRRPDHVEFVQNLSEDLKRRDFTINALAMAGSGEIIDHFGGITDLNNKVVRAVGEARERFHEDALRMMRAVRFVSQLGFTLERDTKKAITENRELLHHIAVERIREEFLKLGLGPDSKDGFSVLIDSELIEDLPLLAGKSSLLKNYLTLNFFPTTEPIFWALIIVLIKLTNDEVRAFMRTWKNSNEVAHQVQQIVECFDIVSERELTNRELFDFGVTTLASTIDLADILGEPVNGVVLIDRYNHLPLKDAHELAVDGRFLMANLGIPAGPRIGRLLQLTLDAILAGQIKNNQKSIAKYVKKITSVV
ncbi:tRNA CCA-pyrophosphorylase [Amylolactobacillus amylotrophicus DSM 20534]|uniref:CCA tRNA nucleotidyltransferase n=3 Tax=Amylolactobacillus TaxID=2767876 RepID=A0A1L6XDX6_9LACO|nr:MULTISPECIES: CCA tRNA nucleotidyltransferase [Amylolactobacillus]APT19174.1 CCA tRNA nucleotidyltransferase [Amylolactobacillus amylophilus DSM 20533 = JCM 1125]KRK38554.1 tRNA CCA-pyrophosphorylase [Amylolactobacillus amylotrophicus DSM 20534]KRM42803.1 tRNA CCA-pyrophosphorylase [Amylolactobacillus amylophilus DSM 20533 = JCM 1125]GED79666.1 CCA-adding enzyme [Amylolactobacillus amylophilus]